MDNCVVSLQKILELLKVKYTKAYVKEKILPHSDHPSLLSISDTLQKYNIQNVTIKAHENQLKEVPLPAIVQVIKNGLPFFYVLKAVKNNHVNYFNDKNENITQSIKNFTKIWTGVILLVERNEASKEEGIEKKIITRRTTNTLIGVSVTSILIYIITSISNSIEFNSSLWLFSVGFYTTLKICGLITSYFLLWYEVDQYNPALQNFCGSKEKKVNCNAVLNSKYASLFNSNISLSNLAFAYFLSSLGLLTILNFSIVSLGFLGILSITAIPIIAVSIYYQAFIIKSWCKFCLILQTILLAEVLTSIIFKFYEYSISKESILLLLPLFLAPIISWSLLKPLLTKAKDSNLYQQHLNKIKNNKTVFESLLRNSDRIINSTVGLGITLKNKAPKYHIVKVCSPYCSFCKKSHTVLKALYNKGIIDLQVIYTAQPSNNDPKSKPVRHFLAIDEMNSEDSSLIRNALNDWYGSNTNDYSAFSRKYPINISENQWDKIKSMAQWCKAERITHTPTIFINGFKLPREYRVENLLDILT